ncbi:flagellar basal body rod protein FlgB [Undibacterium sp.]|jgi:flagellar basal-body rod protein FlgB|uniref:flagellar basal body rod protein FlgB n=1 Tax=Undibacterium sp. TaxID=1914977 RepID=UPI002C6AB1F0|nr:flagellar basal body rod protein FlgB [Undibacterium sp.]HTD05377.1 flagellar basal body rod protein FlgB [Undibacterium sp.]
MVSKLDDYLRFQSTALSVRGERQQLIASNIANADTPNYKAKDIDFASAMNNALGRSNVGSGSQPPSALAKTSAQHLDIKGGTAGGQPQYRGTIQGSVDGNTVDMDVEQNQFTDNALRYEASLTMINMQIRGMLAAVQG